MKKPTPKLIEVEITYNTGMKMKSGYVYPKFRKKRHPKCPFKEQERDPAKWFGSLISFI